MNRGKLLCIRIFSVLFLGANLSGCAEVKKIISVFLDHHTNLSTSAFDIVQMSSGSDVTCSMMGDKSVRCLGSTLNGNLGRFYGAPNENLKDVKQVALGKDFTCAIVGENSAVKCFGANNMGQLGNGSEQSSVDPVSVIDVDGNNAPITEAKQITAGDSHACALLKNGRAVCWGDSSFGQSGNPTEAGYQLKTIMENERSPKPFMGIQAIAAGSNSTCVIAKDDQSLFCFGERYGVSKKNNWVPEKVEMAGGLATLSQVKQIGLGAGFGCALTRSQVYCWGKNEANQLGASINTAGVTKAIPVQVHYPVKAPLSKIEAITVGDKHACALHRDESTVYCWGSNAFGQLGTTSMHGLPEQVAVGNNNLTLKGAKYIAAGRERSCIISRSDELFCWGNGEHGILGSNTLNTPYPTRVIDSNNDMIGSTSAITLGHNHACVIGANKRLYCFGLNHYGQIGSRMIGTSTLANVTALDTYGDKTCVIYGDQKGVGCFGGKDLAQDQENKTNSFVLEEITNNFKPYHDSVGVSVGEKHICIINSEQQIECIDYATKPANHFIVQTDKKAPLKDIWMVRSKSQWNCGITREKGEIWCWGDWKKNQWPQAKQLTFAGKPSTDFIQLVFSDDQICGIHGVSATVYCTTESEVSQNNLNLQNIQTPDGKNMTGVFSITAGKNHICALNDKNQVFCWGSNEYGQLGVHKIMSSDRPVAVSFKNITTHKILHVSAGESHTCLNSSTDISLFCFGKSFFHESNSIDPVEYPL